MAKEKNNVNVNKQWPLNKNIMLIQGHYNEHDNHVFTRFKQSK